MSEVRSEGCSIGPLIAAPKVDPSARKGWNPLAAHSVVAAGSSYLGPSDGVLKHPLDPDQRPTAAGLDLRTTSYSNRS